MTPEKYARIERERMEGATTVQSKTVYKAKENTWMTKEVIFKKKILPYLGKRKLSEITAKDIIDWQNEMMKLRKKDGSPLSLTYLKTIHGELSALFNHAGKYYQLRVNPARLAGCMGLEEIKEMQDCFKMFYDMKPTDRIFQSMSKHILSTEMQRGCKAAGVKVIRLHDLRHSHVSLAARQNKIDKLTAKLKDLEKSLQQYEAFVGAKGLLNAFKEFLRPKSIIKQLKGKEQELKVQKRSEKNKRQIIANCRK